MAEERKNKESSSKWVTTGLLIAGLFVMSILLLPELQPRQVAIMIGISAMALGIGISIFKGKER